MADARAGTGKTRDEPGPSFSVGSKEALKHTQRERDNDREKKRKDADMSRGYRC